MIHTHDTEYSGSDEDSVDRQARQSIDHDDPFPEAQRPAVFTAVMTEETQREKTLRAEKDQCVSQLAESNQKLEDLACINNWLYARWQDKLEELQEFKLRYADLENRLARKQKAVEVMSEAVAIYGERLRELGMCL